MHCFPSFLRNAGSLKSAALFVLSGDGEWMLPDFGFMNETDLFSAADFGASCGVGTTAVAVRLALCSRSLACIWLP
jgi:hypothetical protein